MPVRAKRSRIKQPVSLRPKVGAYDGGQNKTGVDAFASWLGSSVPIASDFPDFSTWTNIEGPAWLFDPWEGFYRLSLAVPMLPTSEVPGGATDTATISTKLAAGASGSFDSHFTALANAMVANGQANAYLRPGWEFNGDWFIWRADANLSAWITYFQRIVTAMRAVVGANFKIVWNPNREAAALSGQSNGTESAWPGASYVDVIAMDVYDTAYGQNITHAARWNKIMNDPYCIQWLIDFAALQSKPIAFSEWGLCKDMTAPRYGGGDSAPFINAMADVILNSSNNCDHHAYWDYELSDIRSKLSDNSAPLAGAAFISRFH